MIFFPLLKLKNLVIDPTVLDSVWLLRNRKEKKKKKDVSFPKNLTFPMIEDRTKVENYTGQKLKVEHGDELLLLLIIQRATKLN